MPVFYPNQKLPVTEIESPEEITADSPDGLYIQEGGTSTPSGGTTIHYYDSLEAAEAANLPDGAFVAVPSEGGGGLTVVELSTPLTNGDVELSAEDAAKMDALNGAPCIIKCSYLGEFDMTAHPTVLIAKSDGTYVYTAPVPALRIYVNITNVEGGVWYGGFSGNV